MLIKQKFSIEYKTKTPPLNFYHKTSSPNSPRFREERLKFLVALEK